MRVHVHGRPLSMGHGGSLGVSGLRWHGAPGRYEALRQLCPRLHPIGAGARSSHHGRGEVGTLGALWHRAHLLVALRGLQRRWRGGTLVSLRSRLWG